MLANATSSSGYKTNSADCHPYEQPFARQAFGQGVAAEGLPTVVLSDTERADGVELVDLLVRAGMASSKSEARRAISGRGIRIDGDVVEDIEAIIKANTLPLRLTFGRKRHAVVT